MRVGRRELSSAVASMSVEQPSVAVLASGSGTLAQAIFDDARQQGDYIVRALVTDKPAAAVVRRAAQSGVPVVAVAPADYADRGLWDAALAEALAQLQPTLIVSAGFMRILGSSVLAEFEGRIINSHPSLLPKFPGAHAVRDALAAGESITGTTVHLVDAGMDTGEVLAQVSVAIEPDDTAETLHERIKVEERRLIVQVMRERLGLRASPRQ